MRNRFILGVAALLATAGTPARAQDMCSDVLKDGTVQKLDYHSYDAFREIVYKRFADATVEDAKKTSNWGFGFNLFNEFGLTANSSDQDIRKRQEQIKSELNLDVKNTSEIDLALSTGDPVIVSAWEHCMQTNRAATGGLALRIEATDSRSATVDIQFYPPAAEPSVKLKDDFLPGGKGIKVVSGRECFKRGTVIKQNSGCIAVLDLAPQTPLTLAVTGEPTGHAKAYLPPRMKWSVEHRIYSVGDYHRNDKAWQLSKDDRAGASWDTSKPEYPETLPNDLIKDGWTMEPNTAQVTLAPWAQPDDTSYNRCDTAEGHTEGPYTLKYSYIYRATSRFAASACHVSNVTVALRRDIWVADRH